MSRNRFFALCVLVLLGAFAGGYLGNRAIPVAHAQVIQLPGKISATEITLVNNQGKVEATLRDSQLTLNDAEGRVRVAINPGGITVHDSNGRLVWSSPRGTGIFPAGER